MTILYQSDSPLNILMADSEISQKREYLFTYSLPITVAYFYFKFIFVMGGGGGFLIYLPCWPFSFSFQSFLLFFTQNKGPSPRSATDFVLNNLVLYSVLFHFGHIYYRDLCRLYFAMVGLGMVVK